MTRQARDIPGGAFIAEYLKMADGSDLPEERIQPNGVDIGVSEVFRTSGRAHFFEDGYKKPGRIKVPPKRPMGPGKDGEVYSLVPGVYPVVYDVEFKIPEHYVARVYPRSRLMRCGLSVESALWDQGYEGQGEGLLKVPKSLQRATIPEDMPIAQMVFLPADEAETSYRGTHQRERLKA